MTTVEPKPTAPVLVAIDIAKIRNEVLIEPPGAARRRRLTILNAREDHDRLVELLADMNQPVTIGFEATGNYHRAIAWRLASFPSIHGESLFAEIGNPLISNPSEIITL